MYDAYDKGKVCGLVYHAPLLRLEKDRERKCRRQVIGQKHVRQEKRKEKETDRENANLTH